MDFKRIIVPTDFSEHSLAGLQYAIEFAEKFSAHLKVVYVIEPVLQVADVTWGTIDFSQLDEAHKESAGKQLRSFVEEKVPAHLTAEAVILTGKPFVEIVKLAEAEKADLIVMATHGRGAVSHILMGSTAERVVRKSPCPVLTVKHNAHRFRDAIA